MLSYGHLDCILRLQESIPLTPFPSSGIPFKTYLRPQKNIYLFPAYRVTKKKFSREARKKIVFHTFFGRSCPVNILYTANYCLFLVHSEQEG